MAINFDPVPHPGIAHNQMPLPNIAAAVSRSSAITQLFMAVVYGFTAAYGLPRLVKSLYDGLRFICEVILAIANQVVRAVMAFFSLFENHEKNLAIALKRHLIQNSLANVLLFLYRDPTWNRPTLNKQNIIDKLAPYVNEHPNILQFVRYGRELFAELRNFGDMRESAPQAGSRDPIFNRFKERNDQLFMPLFEATYLLWPASTLVYQIAVDAIREVEGHFNEHKIEDAYRALTTEDHQDMRLELLQARNPEWGAKFVTEFLVWDKQEKHVRAINTLITTLTGLLTRKSYSTVLAGMLNCKPNTALSTWHALSESEQQAVFAHIELQLTEDSHQIIKFVQNVSKWKEEAKNLHTTYTHEGSLKAYKLAQTYNHEERPIYLDALKRAFPEEQALIAFCEAISHIENVVNLLTSNNLPALKKLLFQCNEVTLNAIDSLLEALHPTIRDLFKKSCRDAVKLAAVRDEFQIILKRERDPQSCMQFIVKYASQISLENWRGYLISLTLPGHGSKISKLLGWLEQIEQLKGALDTTDLLSIEHLFTQRVPTITIAFVVRAFPELPKKTLLFYCARAWSAMQAALQQNWSSAFLTEVNLQKDHDLVVEQGDLTAALQNSLLAKIGEAEFAEVVTGLKNEVGSCYHEAIDTVDLLMHYSMDQSHIQKGEITPQIPKKPQGTNIDELLILFRAINFYKPNAAHYYDPAVYFKEDYHADSVVEQLQREILFANRRIEVEELEAMVESALPDKIKNALEAQLNDFIRKIKGRIAYTGTPASGSTQLREFQTTIENALCHVIAKLKTLPSDGASNAIRADTIIQILRAASHCGPRVYEMAIKRYKERVLGKTLEKKDEVYELLAEYRGLLAESRMPPSGSETIVYYMKFAKNLGKILNLPFANLFENPNTAEYNMGGNFDANRDLVRFFGHYNVVSISAWIASQMSRDDLIDLCKAHVPKTWQPAEMEAVQASLKAARASQMKDPAILQLLRDKHDIWALNMTPEQAIADWRQSLYLEREAIQTVTQPRKKAPKMQIKPKAILGALVAAGVLQRH